MQGAQEKPIEGARAVASEKKGERVNKIYHPKHQKNVLAKFNKKEAGFVVAMAFGMREGKLNLPRNFVKRAIRKKVPKITAARRNKARRSRLKNGTSVAMRALSRA